MNKLPITCLAVMFIASACRHESDVDDQKTSTKFNENTAITIGLSSPIFIEKLGFTESIWLLGEVKNSSTKTVIASEVSCDVSDLNGDVTFTRSTSVLGTTIRPSGWNSNSNSALLPGGTGFYRIPTLLYGDNIGKIVCKLEYTESENYRETEAKLELFGELSVTESSKGFVQIHGQAKNIGTTGLINATAIIVTRGKQGEIIDIEEYPVLGPRLVDGAGGVVPWEPLLINGIGRFGEKLNYHIPYSNYGGVEVRFSWEDADLGSYVETM